MDTHYCTNCCILHYLTALLHKPDVEFLFCVCFKYSCVVVFWVVGGGRGGGVEGGKGLESH